MKLQEAKIIAEGLVGLLAPHCEKVEIAGSIRRKRPEVKDIEIVAVAKPFDVGLFESGIATVVNRWEKVKGELPCKYTQRVLPEGIKLDLFFATQMNWGWIWALRTGSGDYNQQVYLRRLKAAGYEVKEGNIWANGRIVRVANEYDLFTRMGMDWVDPKRRESYAPHHVYKGN